MKEIKSVHIEETVFEHRATVKMKAFKLVLHVIFPMEGTISMKAFIA